MKAFEIIFGGLFYGAYGIAILVVGGWWMIGLAVVILGLPIYEIFKASPPVGVILVLVFFALVLHRFSRPSAVARRGARRIDRRVKRELKIVPDDLPL